MRPFEVPPGGFSLCWLQIEISKAPFPGCVPMDNLNAQRGLFFILFLFFD
jgi:hypothetical protein